MKKALMITMLGLIMALFIPAAPAKAQIFDKGDFVLNLGLGIGATYYTGLYYKTSFPPVFVSGDYCLREALGPGNLGVGGYMGYNAYKWEYTYSGGTWGYKYSTFIIGPRGTYHFVDLVDNLDLYGGVLLGARIVTSKEFGDYYGYNYTANSSGVAYSLFAGARYYFTPNFGVMAELGYGIAYLSLAASLKF
ncbi:MAG: outer membrane beta-barrel protein [Bacteroidales bacterium]|nr:outer membrane beta-barrel protein [Bacteroidales bacterium]